MGDIKISLLIFVLALLIFHVLIYFQCTKKRFWTQIDYFWVSLSFIGLVGINKDIRTEKNKWTIADCKHRINWEYKEALANSDHYQKFYDPKTTNFKYYNFKDKDQVTAFTKVASWYNNMSDTLRKYKLEILEKDNYIPVKTIKKYSDDFPFTKEKFPELVGTKELVGNYINDVDKEVNTINKILAYESYSEWELILKFISPWFLSIAIAMRLSKVTAQLKGIA